MAQDAVALLEISSIAKGYVALDAVAKRAMVTVKMARPITPGKFVLLFSGDVASVAESLEAAREVAGSLLIDDLFLALAHEQLMPALTGDAAPDNGESLGIVEMTSIASAVHAADIALKATDVAVVKMHLALGIGGKGYFTLAGELADVEASLECVRDQVREERIVAIELIARPHGEVRGFLV